MYLARSDGGKRSPDIENVLAINTPPPILCNARNPISLSMDVANST